ncbi:SDR family NAD(P)-dependent oxidoreductase [Streptomyces coeruleorubidus]|uniref:SDR family NAD(P)-dependent oxidoreductase n=1 Tax=Streptomyces coeruleorubidus TaxID=116188 RepID=UPI0031581FC5
MGDRRGPFGGARGGPSPHGRQRAAGADPADGPRADGLTAAQETSRTKACGTLAAPAPQSPTGRPGRRCRGALVNISSNGARMPHAGPVPYTTAKAALTAFGKALAEEFGPQGVRINTISPGPVRTAMWESPDGYGAELARSMGVTQEQLLTQIPTAMGMTTGRLLEPSEVATAVAYLASPLAASMSGTDLLIDGGSVKTA